MSSSLVTLLVGLVKLFVGLFVGLFVIALLISLFSPSKDQYKYTVKVNSFLNKNVFVIAEMGKDSLEYIKFLLEGEEVQIAETESISYQGVDFRPVPVYINCYKTATTGFDTVEVKFKTQTTPVDVFVAAYASDQLLAEWMETKSGLQLSFQPVVVKKTDKNVSFVLEPQ